MVKKNRLIRSFQAASQGVRIAALNFGGGFAVGSEIRNSGDILDVDRQELQAVPEPGSVASFEQVCSAISLELPGALPISCLMEPGRLLVSDAFHLITRVVRIKEESGTCFAILDAGRIQNALFAGRGYHEIIPVLPARSSCRPYTLVGPLCASFDVFARSRMLPELAEDDIIAIMDVGAYNLSARSWWSFDPAKVVSVRPEGAVVTEM